MTRPAELPANESPASVFGKIARPPLWRFGSAIAALACLAVVSGQPLDRSPAARASRAAGRAADFRSALGHASAGNFAAAEAALSKGNLQRPNSLEWDIESAVKLAHLAQALRDAADFRNARGASERALAQLNHGLASRGAASPPARRAQVFEVAAFIYERLLFDRAAAGAALAQAQALAPGAASIAAELARIQDAEAGEARVRGGKG